MTAPYIKGSATSEAAAKSMEQSLSTLQKKLLVLVTESGKRGMTCDELEHRTNIRHQTLSARVRELYLRGRIYRTKRTRTTRSGRQAVVYRTRRKTKPPTMCMCDRPTCSRFPCKLLREYRITHKLISEIVESNTLVERDSIQELLDHIESECEILVK